MTPVSDALALAGLLTFAAAFPVVAVAGPVAGAWTAGVGVALMFAGFAVGAVQRAVGR